nr:grasp-with-spasm system ATP-grasp peptide maturase [uncultured Marinifilum sp.]
MILILSIHEDQSTNEVINWLSFYKLKFVRINEDTPILVSKIVISNEELSIKLNIDGNYFDLKKVTAFWYRRGEINLANIINKTKFNEITDNLFFERKTVRDFIQNYLKNKSIRINSFDDININKLIVLQIAREVGLNIPNTFISEKKKLLEDFCYNKCITKPLSDTFNINSRQGLLKCYTNEIISKDLDIYNTLIFPSLLQEKIKKKYELRIFYFHGEFYSMAIFSQNNSETKIDFRKYNKTTYIRNVPFQIPNHIADKLNTLMIQLGLDCGSVDMIVDNTNKYWFLEVNPIGQFGMVSEPCNYNLNERIARYLGNG